MRAIVGPLAFRLSRVLFWFSDRVDDVLGYVEKRLS